MKVIVAGATGSAGSQALKCCLADERITSILVLTRRTLPEAIATHEKVNVILHDDFLEYHDSLMQQLEGAEACIWAIGGRVEQLNNDKEFCHKVNVEYTLAAARAMQEKKLASHTTNGKFRFVFCSGKFSEWDPDKKLWFMGDSRRIKGEAEKGLCELADAHPDTFEARIIRPSGFIEANTPAYLKTLAVLYSAIPAPQVGKCLVKVAVEGWKDRIIENDVLRRM